MVYKNNEQIKLELKKIMLEENLSQKEVAEKFDISPQAVTKFFKKKNFTLEDAKKVLDLIDYEIRFDFTKKEPTPK